MGDASPSGTGAVSCKDMLSHYPQFSRALDVEYRLSQAEPWPIENPFPAAVIDAIVAYNYLVNELGFKPSNILVMGDSAGGTIGYQLVRYLVQEKMEQLPPPAALLLLSPSLDWGNSHKGPGASFWKASSTDWVHAYMAGYCAKTLLGRLPESELEVNSWLSPASHNLSEKDGIFTDFPPTLFFAGEAEMTLDSMKTAYERMVKDVGKDKVEFVLLPDATHIIFALPWHDEEKEAGYQAMKPFIDRYF
jgi:acetyl esterase/lipase